MSWSVSAIGKAPAVATAISEQFRNSSPCSEPEESIRQLSNVTIQRALEAMPANQVVKVSASGSQGSTHYPPEPNEGVTNKLQLEVNPQYGFVE